MQIHIVEEGDSLFSLAQMYNSSAAEIAEANELPEPDRLVAGQSVVIPITGSFYDVQEGDSLFEIADKFGISVDELARINQVSMNEPLNVGLRLYIPPLSKTTIETNAYVEPIGDQVSENLIESARNRAPFLTYLAPFSYELNRDGTLKPPLLDDFPAIADENSAALMMVVTNLEEGAFSDNLGAAILTSEEAQNTLLDEIIQEAQEVGYGDIHFDFEYLRPEDKERYNDFLRKAAERLRQEGLLISTALAPKTSADQEGKWYEAHDYGAHGEIVDFVVLMTYEWGYSGGPPMAVSPIGPVREVVEYALTEMPAEKIMLGQNLYGYDWTLPFTPGEDMAEAVSPNEAVRRAYEYNVPIEYDEESQAPTYTYTDEEGDEHEVWFEDARSIEQKFNLIDELGLRGISYWKLGLPFPQNWLILSDRYDVKKL
ncbi:glycoside hydrolase family 18 protein [Alteribacter keqinensis]|uniref:LysM peptidoglycan-binding domain-containing protein n=1 Tax=Alteribacter keqinensis TaxID=2483800 RepID=A0A3M7TYF6_9BACI|nr:glycoside hydrolase family 18 protein [Alteribacter keqinensis]RNA69455.1 LysM peptidoglycan-binding domain-containing protein [Alteribacter keqinensis]